MEPVEATINLVSEQSKVNTNVMLAGGFPLDVIVATLVANITIRQDVATVGSCDIVGRTCCTTLPKSCRYNGTIERIASSIGYLLITRLTP